jgi:hypothetical protein
MPLPSTLNKKRWSIPTRWNAARTIAVRDPGALNRGCASLFALTEVCHSIRTSFTAAVLGENVVLGESWESLWARDWVLV